MGLGLISCGGSGSGTGSTGSGGSGSGSGGGSGAGSNSVAVNITGGSTAFSGPLGIGVDGSGNVWVVNSGTNFGNSVTELTKASNFSASSAINISGGSTGFEASKFLAIDESGNIWITNGLQSNSVTELKKASGYSAASALNVPGFDGTGGIAVDQAGNIWVPSFYGNAMIELPYAAVSAPNATAASIDASAIVIAGGSTGFSNPTMAAVDQAGNVWVTNTSYTSASCNMCGSITELTKASGYSAAQAIDISGWGGSKVLPLGIAIDHAGNVWMTGLIQGGTPSAAYAVTELTKASGYAPQSAINISVLPTVAGGGPAGLALPTGIAVDGADNIWVADSGLTVSGGAPSVASGGVTELTKASGYSATSAKVFSGGTTGLATPIGIAIDGQGNIWVTNGNISLTGNTLNGSGGSVTELIGVAVPVTPPLL
ncbi:MAG: Vgb family protein [Candidatus Saccharimonadales bacterium]